VYRLVIVDDEETSRNALCDYFPWEENGFEVISQFSDGRSALKYITANEVDVVLCDIIMPDMDGLTLAEQLYAQRRDIKLIIFSAYRNFDYAKRALLYGVKDYLIKPAKYRELVEVFARLRAELDAERSAFHAEQEVETVLPESICHSARIIQDINEYLEKNYRSATLESAAHHVGLNASYLSQYYKAKTGLYFSDVLTRIRMERALQLLNDYHYRISDISEMVGYMNAKNFSRAFKRYYGKLPSEQRSDP